MADPMPIGDVLKEHRSKWPKLFATVETGAATSESSAVTPKTPSKADETRSVPSETGAAGSETRAVEVKTVTSKPLSEKLFDLFGGGDNVSLRRTLYLRCQLTVQTFGKPAEMALREVVQAAKLARRPGNYFAFSIVRRFRELGFLEDL